jgi:hypothetical protein
MPKMPRPIRLNAFDMNCDGRFIADPLGASYRRVSATLTAGAAASGAAA